jgi:hypothetical protein
MCVLFLKPGEPDLLSRDVSIADFSRCVHC